MSIKNIIESHLRYQPFNIPYISNILNNHRDSIEVTIASLSTEFDGPNYLQATKVVETRLCERKQGLETRLLLLNGTYYQDPKSLIHAASLRTGPNAQTKLADLIAERDQIKIDLDQVNEELKKNKAIQSFLKITKVNVELISLCGKTYGDKNALLDKAWKAFQEKTGTKAQYEELESRRQDLERKKITLQPLCSGISISNITKMQPNFIKHYASERKEALDAIAFIVI